MKKVIILALAIFAIGFVSAAGNYIPHYWDLSENTTFTQTGIIYSDSVLIEIDTPPAECRYSDTPEIPYNSMTGIFDNNDKFETMHRKEFLFETSASEGTHKYYIKCKNKANDSIKELEFTFTTKLKIYASISIDSYLTAGDHEIRLTTSEIPKETPKLSYTYDGISYTPIVLTGEGKEWTGYITISKSEGERTGMFKFEARGLYDSSSISKKKIISGETFKVDTKSPSSVNSLEATGQYRQIKLQWFTAEKDLDYINVYRSTSPNVGLDDFYDKFDDPEEKEYLDENIETGKTYYYKISPVDKAGNEASLSIEVSASGRLDNKTSSNTGLSSSLFYLVDSVVTDIETLESEVATSKTFFNSREDSEKKLLEYTGVFNQIDAASSQLTALKKDVVSYKLQGLTKSLLNSKLDSARLKINIIKKTVPEESEVLKESSSEMKISKENVDILTQEYAPDLTSFQESRATKDVMKIMKDNNFVITTSMKVFDITYLDGTKTKKTVISHSIPSTLERMDGYSILLKIPNSINYEDIIMKNTGYKKLSNYMLEFESDTKKISYTIDGEVDPEVTDNILISLVKHPEDKSSITGNSIVNLATPGLSITILVLVVSSLVVYLIIMKKKHSDEEVSSFIAKAKEVKNLQKSGKHEEAIKLYESLKLDYIALPQESKSKVFNKISHLHKK